MGYSYGSNKSAKPQTVSAANTAVTSYSREDLEKLTLKELKMIGAKYGTTDRSREKLIDEILKLSKK